jgi:SET domain
MECEGATLGQTAPRRALARRWLPGSILYAGTPRGSRASLGKGLFAKRSFRASDPIFAIEGCVIHRRNRSVVEAIQYPNAVGMARHKWIDPSPNNPLRFINHSCDANVGYREDGRFVALRDIRKGHELTLDYSITESDLLWDFTPQTPGGGVRVREFKVQTADSLDSVSSALRLPRLPSRDSSGLSYGVSPISRLQIGGNLADAEGRGAGGSRHAA